MNKKVFSLALLSFSLLVMAENSDDERKILPYSEADDYIDTHGSATAIGWVTPSKIIYGIDKPRDKDTGREEFASKIVYDYQLRNEVKIFDLDANKAEFYRNGELLNYRYQIATIRLNETMKTKDSSEEESDVRLVGRLGEETQQTYYRLKQPKPPRKCPTDNIDGNEYQPILLKSEHGCVRTPNQKTMDSQWIYFRADGEKIPLNEMPTGGLGWAPAHWIEWLQAYLIGDTVTKSASWLGESTTSLELLSSDGKLKVIEMGEFGLQHARPTRAGMVAAKNLSDNGLFVAPAGGLRLWRDGKIYKITEGSVLANEVSPDGCKVAYVVQLKKQPLVKGHKAKLRVVDVCKAFGVANDVNPF